MRKDNLAFLVGGLAYGILIGFGASYVVDNRPGAKQAEGAATGVPGPAGPAAPTQVAGDSGSAGAPMVAEITALKRRLSDDPKNLATLTRLANLYHDAGMWTQAIDYYGRALEVDPDNPNLLTDSGICYRQTGDFRTALERFRRAHEKDPSHWQSLYNIAIVEATNMGRYDRALDAVESLEKLDVPVGPLAALRRAVEQAKAEADAGERSAGG